MGDQGFWLLFVRKGQVFIPTMAKTEAGFYMGIEPVEVVSAQDRAGVEDALLRAVRRGNPIVPTPSRANFPQSPLLRHAKVRSLSMFEKTARSWKLSKRDDAYFIVPYLPHMDGGAEEDLERGEGIPIEEGLEFVINRLVARAISAQP